jgi:hypothetical protein
VIEGVVRRPVSEVARGVPVSGGTASRPEVLADVVGSPDRNPARVGGHSQAAATGQLGEHIAICTVEPRNQVGSVNVIGRGNQLDGAREEVGEPASG